MKFKAILILSLFAITSFNAYAEKDFESIEIKTTSITNQIAMLQGSGGNIGVIHGEDGLLMVDDQFVELSEKIKKALQKLNSGKVKFLLNTHWHFDHTGGNRAFGREATIISHENVRKLLTKDQVIETFNKTVKASPKVALPVVTFKESVTLHFNNNTIDVIHLPSAHTSGDSYVYFREANVLHAGDLFFNGFFPFIDVDHGGSIEGYIQAIEHLLKLTDSKTKIIPGHGPLAKKKDLKKFLAMLIASKKFVAGHIKAGLSLEEVKKKTLPSKWDSWKDGFLNEETWLGIVYSSLKG